MTISLLLLLACAGPDSMDSGDSGAADPGPSSGSLRTLTYNVHGLPSAITGDDTPGRMEQIAPLLPPFDLIGLQEDFDEANHASLVSQCEHPVQDWFSEKVDENRAYGSGLAMLGPGTATLVHHQHYSACNGVTDGASDCLASKGFQLVRLDVGQAELDVYNTHLEAGNGDEDDAARAVQIDELLAAMEKYSTGRPIIFMGDTNLHDDDPEDLVEVTRLKDFGLRDSCDEIGCPDPGRIDRVMLRDGDDVTLAATGWQVAEGFVDDDGVPLSDHDPVAVMVDWAAH